MNELARILVVSGDTSILRATSRILKSAGYRIIEAATGEEGLRAAQEQAPDLVLLDVALSDLDGVEVCRRIKAAPVTARAFVVLLSNVKTDSESQANGIEAGADGYITRPVSDRELLARVQALLRIKSVEDALRASEDKFKYVFDYSIIGKSITLPAGEIHVNRAFCEMLGYSPEELENKNWQAITHPDDILLTQKLVDSILSGQKESGRIEKRYIHANGSVVWTDIATSLRRDKDGKPLYFMTSVMDISERKRAEEELRALSTRHQAMLAAIPDIIMEVDNNKVYTWANQAGLQFFGADVVGKEAAFYFEGEQKTYQVVQPLFNGSEDVIYVESWQRRRDGEKRLLAWWCRTLKDAQGNVTGALSTARDITERKRAEAAVKEYSERLEQMVEARTRELRAAQDQLLRQERLAVLGQIAGGISHELRSPLGAIKNALYLLNLAQPSPDLEMVEILQILERQVANSEQVITSLMDFARPQPPRRRATDVRDVLDAALAQSALPENIVVRREFAETLPEANADPDQLQIVFGNLIRNATQAMPEGGELTIAARQAALSFRAERETSDAPARDFSSHPSTRSARSGSLVEMTSLEISFGDTGVGIAPELLDKIFQPMFTTKARGLGLGLALCKLLIEGHGGKIQVTSQVGKGTTFTIVLPMGD